MLRKLLKYEFKATARILLPLYGALIIFSIINKFFIGTNNNYERLSGLGHIPAVITMFAYVATMVAVIVVTFFIIIQRFYKNLLGDEGYLMNTIPVSLNKNLMSKLIVAIVWNIVSVAIAIISIVIMAYTPGDFSNVFRDIGQILYVGFSEIGINMVTILIEIIIIILVGVVESTLMIYASISLGHLANRRKILSSFGAFIVLSMVINSIFGAVSSFINIEGVVNITTTNLAPIHKFLLFGIGSEILLSIIFYVICHYVLRNKLNLE
ncbi:MULTISPECIES: ABC transporter permease [Clostridium]|uniref:ABC transporter permease n=1 Tax=Clostridium cibarium TaxID=2762247 RepID=A0ABR8PVH3_9CLOT|nr:MULTISPECIES: ABC transporter permease [Clostridium]MBD7912149.1 ABC transporter permease [Clostridium cibarium]